MYWIYLAIFILVIFTPKVVRDGFFFLREEDVEALVIFGFGIFGFMLYLVKEKALLRVFQEKLRLQKKPIPSQEIYLIPIRISGK